MQDNDVRTYRPAAGSFIFYVSLGVIVLAAGLAGTFYFYTTHGRDHSILLSLISLGFVVLGGSLVAMMVFAQLILTPDEVTVRSVFTSRSMRREDVKGYRRRPMRYGPDLYVLVSNSPAARKLEISGLFKLDSNFFNWLPPDSDLDLVDYQNSLKEIENDSSLGNTPEDRIDKLTEASRYGRIVSGVSGGIAAWAFFYPKPYKPLVAALSVMPLAAMWLIGRYPGLFRVDQKRGDAHPTIAFVLLLSCLSTYRAVMYVSVLHWGTAIGYAAMVALLLLLAFGIADRTVLATKSSAVTLFVLLWVIGLGAVLNANALFDHSVAATYSAVVTEKHMYKSEHEVELSAWGPSKGSEEDISRKLYDSVEPGSTVCVYLWQGALRIPNYAVDSCP
jgi:hypothetical protein